MAPNLITRTALQAALIVSRRVKSQWIEDDCTHVVSGKIMIVRSRQEAQYIVAMNHEVIWFNERNHAQSIYALPHQIHNLR